MLQLWVRDGHNSFIHRRLYGKTMPGCVRDAFVTLAAYTSCTVAVKETILQTAEVRTSALLRDSPPTAIGRHSLLAHLARTQALFVYMFIQLFDGSVRMRASAEKHIPTLRRWVTQMWEVAKEYQGQDSSLGSQLLHWNASEFDREYEVSSEMWQLWILTESVRRTHLVVSTIANSYQTMTKGWAECSGAVMITARLGLWEVESAVKWFQLASAKPPLLVPALEPGPFISQYQADECDPFVTKLWGYFIGADRIQCWVDKSNKTSDYDLTQSTVHIDTARDYIGSEKLLGQAEASSRFTVDTKIHSGTPGDHEPAKIELSIGQSLQDLGVSSVETMYLHVPDRQTPFEDTAKAMHDALQQGKFKKFGLSNYSAAEVQKFIEICEEKGYTKPSVYQGQYNALVRGGEKELFPLLRKHNISFHGFSAAAGGFFTGDPNSSERWSKDNAVGAYWSKVYGKPPVQASVGIVREAAAKFSISGHTAALRWTAFHSILDGKYGDGIIFGVSKMEQLYNTLDAIDAGPLPAELADAITAIYATVEGSEPPYHL
ncbi:putative aldo/keto reductase [Thozetella sp. PMI_491]|nr:putative aldo/keto reductase [Thozetella sp. PMI_491]